MEQNNNKTLRTLVLGTPNFSEGKIVVNNLSGEEVIELKVLDSNYKPGVTSFVTNYAPNREIKFIPVERSVFGKNFIYDTESRTIKNLDPGYKLNLERKN